MRQRNILYRVVKRRLSAAAISGLGETLAFVDDQLCLAEQEIEAELVRRGHSRRGHSDEAVETRSDGESDGESKGIRLQKPRD